MTEPLQMNSDTTAPEKLEQQAWHAMPVDAVLTSFESSKTGLATWKVEENQKIYGENRLPEGKVRSPFLRFMLQFHNVLIYVLIAAGVVTAMLQHWVDASVIFGVVLLNAIIGYLQEGKAEDALKAIKKMLSPVAMTIRDGKKISIPAAERTNERAPSAPTTRSAGRVSPFSSSIS